MIRKQRLGQALIQRPFLLMMKITKKIFISTGGSRRNAWTNLFLKTVRWKFEFLNSNSLGKSLEKTTRQLAELLQISGLSHGTDVWLGNAEEFKTTTFPVGRPVSGWHHGLLQHKGLPDDLAFKIMEFVRKGRGSPRWMDWSYEGTWCATGLFEFTKD